MPHAGPSRKGAFSSSVVVSANAQHARFIAATIYQTCGIVVTSARLTTHSSGPSSFYPTLGVCLGPNRPRRCRRGGRISIIGDAWISEGRRSVPRPHITSTASRVVLRPLIGRDALNSIQATPKTQSPLAVAAGFHRAMAAATGNQVSGGSPRPRPRPPEISTCGGLSRPGRRRRAARHQIPVVLYMAIHHRASCLDCHCLAPSPVRAAYCLRASLSTRATPRTRVARSATATYHRLVSVPLALYGNVATASRRRSIARPTVCTRHSRPMRRREHGSRGP